MAGSSLLVLIDDIATLLDDVAAMSKVAAKKTAGVLGDDLALNAQQVTGIQADRELPVVWAVAKGSFLNKLILVPLALLISLFAPWAITPLLVAGGLFLCYEGVEKLFHAWLHSKADDEARHQALAQAVANPQVDLVAFERDKIKGAIRTDFILSAEIVAITLGIVATSSLTQQVLVLSTVAVAITIGVYGLVAAIVKMDDAGLYLSKQSSAASQALGQGLLRSAPVLMKALSVLGTVAMFLVGGGILVHGWPLAHDAVHAVVHSVEGWPAVGPVAAAITPTLLDGVLGVVAGVVVLGAVTLISRAKARWMPSRA
jgi:predicted DNA repair protein MutK